MFLDVHDRGGRTKGVRRSVRGDARRPSGRKRKYGLDRGHQPPPNVRLR